MKPLPADAGGADPSATAHRGTPSAPSAPCSRAYPWLLLLSTGVAGLFCYLYLTKPVIERPAPAPTVGLAVTPAPETNKTPAPIQAAPQTAPPQPLAETKPQKPVPLAPSSQRLPGDLTAAPAPPSLAIGKTGAGVFEETNLRVQHILIAEAPGGTRSRLEFEVPVLYRSRNLRWSKQEVARARELLGKLADYQEKTRDLRAEGIALLDAWNHLVNRSIPGSGLRADSPSLPANQDETATRQSIPDTSEAVRLHPAGK